MILAAIIIGILVMTIAIDITLTRKERQENNQEEDNPGLF